MKTTRSKDGTMLAYDTYGKGPALIFITGATCFRSFAPVLHDAKVFAEEFTVYNYDRRGRGNSGNTMPYAMERELEDIEAMIDVAGGRANIYGHSSGAILALEATIRLGQKVKKLVMYDPAYSNDEANQEEFKALSQGLYRLLDSGKHDQAIRIFLEGIGTPKEVIMGMQQSPQWETMVALAPTLAYDTTLALDLPPVTRAARLTTPTQIIVGEESPTSIHDTANQLSKAIPNSAYFQLEGQDHMPNPEMLLPVLSRFLKP
ncbi:MAG: alpha/beta fold hydrolase [Bacillota bacterium]|uniref:Alpha/beta hydrolase n=1 Tax=Virgibacillus salarius TaxID=447199 RepID=A0A941IB81_9BACI|nr:MULTISPECIES: alpha/beta hydrolase [Bacillaceae]MBR7797463.1 alpha/beta hydrolase [Virgibacillus salarius]MDY7042708.1 alpha/beta hydrolase [Virgibacillus sp. M23]NAZ10174.1 alpha/beta fold hydrolase [Agaribacter marinus]WBX79399.1 alpha/beta hydrolase [Virgibacillus salarius]